MEGSRGRKLRFYKFYKYVGSTFISILTDLKAIQPSLNVQYPRPYSVHTTVHPLIYLMLYCTKMFFLLLTYLFPLGFCLIFFSEAKLGGLDFCL